jgi:tetratricopeptide (TPR) repeat protein
MGSSLLAMGEFIEGRCQLQQTQELSAGDKDDTAETRFTQNNGIAALAYLAWVLWPLGYPKQAITAARQAVLRARERGHVPLTAFCLYIQAFLCNAFDAGDDAAEALALAAIDYCVEHRVIAYEHWARFCQGIALQRRGSGREAISMMREAMAAAENLDAEFLRPLHLGHLAAAEASVGRVEIALDLLEQAVQIAAQRRELFFMSELHRLRGEMLIAAGQQSDGEAELQRALEDAHRDQARLWELRAATSLARHWLDRDRNTEAAELLTPIYSWFGEGFGTGDLIAAKALLNEAGIAI